MQALEVTKQSSDLIAFTNDQVDLIKSTIAKGATDDELKLFLHFARRTGLDPLAKQIYFQKRRNNKTQKDDLTIITGIDGYRLIADRTGKYVGNDDPVFDNENQPRKATVTVYKMIGGVRCPFTASARWEQYFPGDAMGFMWRKMPHLMLGKCAEALALRKAFPAELSGVYIKEEMDQAQAEDSRPIQVVLHKEPPQKRPFNPEDKDHLTKMLKMLVDRQVTEPEDQKEIIELMRGKASDELDKVLAYLKGELDAPN